MSHLGRPKGTVEEDARLDPVAAKLQELAATPVVKFNETVARR